MNTQKKYFFAAGLTAVVMIGITVTNAKERIDSEKVIDEAKASFVTGVTTPSEVEAFFRLRKLEFHFVTRQTDAQFAPQFQWSSNSSTGYYVAVIPRVRTRWIILSYESIRIYIEIDRQVVSKTVFESIYTGL